MTVSLEYQLNMQGTWEFWMFWLLLRADSSDFNIKSPCVWLFVSTQMKKKNSLGLCKWYSLICVGTFEGLFTPTSLDSFNTQQKERRDKVWKNTNIFLSCNLLHQPAFPCSCDYYIMTWLLTIIATVGKVKARHGAISIKGIWNSITSSKAAWLLCGWTQKYISIYLRCCLKENPNLHHYFI